VRASRRMRYRPRRSPREDRLVHNLRLLTLLSLVLAAALLPGSGRAVSPTLNATVGPGFSIRLTNASGTAVARVAPGTYTIHVRDLSVEHNFHLTGAGVDQSTAVDATADTTWNVTFAKGTYSYRCDAHPTLMRGSFRAGTALPLLNGRVGPGRTISLKTTGGTVVKSVAAGGYRIAVRDATKKDNFHLLGPGVNKRTGIRFRGSVKWTVTFRNGKRYTIRSDAHRKLRRTFTAAAKILPPPPPGAGR
jgi:hypothetical protein